MLGPKNVFLLAQLTSSLMCALGGVPQRRNATMKKRTAAAIDDTASRVSSWTHCQDSGSPWELGDLAESDIKLRHQEDLSRALTDLGRMWQNQELPYTIETRHFLPREENTILRTIDDFNKLSCFQIVPLNKTVHKDHVRITGVKGGCYSEIGRLGGEQEINLQPPKCLQKGTIYHELMHTLGFTHEHNAPHRDEYIQVMWENVVEGKKRFFRKAEETEVPDIGVDYDYGSIMHASKKSFSKNENITIQTRDKSAVIGQRKKMSLKDILKLKKRYNC